GREDALDLGRDERAVEPERAEAVAGADGRDRHLAAILAQDGRLREEAALVVDEVRLGEVALRPVGEDVVDARAPGDLADGEDAGGGEPAAVVNEKRLPGADRRCDAQHPAREREEVVARDAEAAALGRDLEEA